MQQHVWMYWENLPGMHRAPYLDLCIDTVRRHAGNLEVRIVNREEMVHLIPDLDEDVWLRLPAPSYRSDYARARLLYQHGGIWLDVDTIAVAPLSRLLDETADTDFVTWGRETGRCFTNVAAARAGASFLKKWIEAQDELLNRTVDWSTLDYPALVQNITPHIDEQWKSIPQERIAPVQWQYWEEFLSSWASPSRILSSDPLAVVLWNAAMGPKLRNVRRDEVLRSATLLGRLLRISLGLSSVSAESNRLRDLAARLRYSRNGLRVAWNFRRLVDPSVSN
jgi:hypothetical protein